MVQEALEKSKKQFIGWRDRKWQSRSVRLTSLTWKTGKLLRRRLNFKKAWCISILPRYTKLSKRILKFTSLWSFVKTGNSSTKSTTLVLSLKKKLVEFSIRFCQLSSTWRTMESVIEISSLKMFFSTRTGMSNSSTSDLVVRLKNSEEPFVELHHTLPLK